MPKNKATQDLSRRPSKKRRLDIDVSDERESLSDTSVKLEQNPPIDIEEDHDESADVNEFVAGIAALNSQGHGLSEQDIARFQRKTSQDSKNKAIHNSLAELPASMLVVNRDRAKQLNYVYNHVLKKQPIASNQQSSGRCWMFAALNMLRLPMMEKYDLENFEFSQAHLFFWDKLERANWILELVCHLRSIGESDPIQNRLMSYYMHGDTNILEDGGYWYHFTNLVSKYGLMPKTNFEECYNSSNTAEMNEILKSKLAEYCRLMNTVDPEQAQEQKQECLTEFYGLLSKFMGEPPKKFTWQFYDQNHTYHEIKNITPLEFSRIYVPNVLENKTVMVHDPRPENPYYATYVVDYFGNMIGGMPNIHFNFPINRLKKYVADSVKNNEAVWFCCDVGKCFDFYRSVLDTRMFDYQNGIGVKFGLNKADRLRYGDSSPTHAMLITGVDEISPGKYRKWRVENSWGAHTENKESDDPLKGYIMMSDEYFDQYVYCVAVDAKYITDQDATKLSKCTGPIILPAWDPFGAVAKTLM